MTPDRATLPTVAPGQWRLSVAPNVERQVRVSFGHANDPQLTAMQLDRWNAALVLSQSAAIALPEFIRGASTPLLIFKEPDAIGAATAEGSANASPLELLKEIAAALDDLHAHGVVHGALAFASVWRTSEGRVQFPDAALAHALDGLVDASPEVYVYRAPEVWHGAPPEPASDQFSLAVMAYELFTGLSRRDNRLVEGIVAIEPIRIEPKVLAEAHVPSGVAEVLQRALSAKPLSRFSSCSEFVAALEAEYARTLPDVVPERTFVRRKRGADASAIGLAVAAVIVIAVALLAVTNQDRARDIASALHLKVPALFRANAQSEVAVSNTQLGQSALERGITSSVRDPGFAPRAGARGHIAPGTLPPLVAPFGTLVLGESPYDGPRAIRTLVVRPGVIVDRWVLSNAPDNAFVVRDAVARATGEGAYATAHEAVDIAHKLDSVKLPFTNAASAAMQRSTTTRIADGTLGTSPTSPSRASPIAASVAVAGTVQFAVPRGSRLYIDGTLTRVEHSSVDVQPGTHDIDVLPPSGAAVRRRITIAAGDTVQVKIPTP